MSVGVAIMLPGVLLLELLPDMKSLNYLYIGIGSASIIASIPIFIVGAVLDRNITNQIKKYQN